jgi:hypothetical protein
MTLTEIALVVRSVPPACRRHNPFAGNQWFFAFET